MRFPTLATAMLLVSIAAPVSFVTAAPPEGKGPATEAVTVQLNLTGVATRTDGGPDGGFVAYINVTGEGGRRTPNGNGVQVRANDLTAEIKVVRPADNTTVAAYTALVDFHAQQASAIAQGLEPGNFRFSLGLHGDRDGSVVAIETGDRVMAMNAHGTTLGPAGDDGFHAVQGKGQTTLKAGGENSATHYNVAIGGTGAILSAE